MGGIHVFTLARVPVFFSPWYLLIVYIFARHEGTLGGKAAVAGAMTISLLGHEFGHALMARRLNLNPRVLLHGMGGMCMHERARSNKDDALVVASGPLAGLLLCGMTYAFLTFAGPPQNAAMMSFMQSMLWFNLVWSVFNLLPLWPMDGGQLFRLGMLRFFKPVRAERVTHITALVALAALAYFVGSSFGVFGFLILGMMGLQNVRALRGEGASAPVRGRESELAKELLQKAEDAHTQGDDRAAARLCHQLRAEGHLSEKTLGRAWQILGVATTRQGSYREALSFLKRAPANREVIESTAQCLYQLDMFEELRSLTESPGFAKLPSDVRGQVLAALEEDDGDQDASGGGMAPA